MQHPLSLFAHCPKCGASNFTENDFKSKRCCSCGFVYYFNPAAATVAVITNSKGELLVATRSKEPAKGTLDLPGGFCDCNESAEEGVMREVMEETGLKAVKTTYLFSIPNIYRYSGMDIHTVDMFFRCEVDESAPLQANDDVQELQWTEIGSIDSSKFGLDSIRKGIERIVKEGLI
ncbi:MAG: NUDIX domain-containing protein [Bacteroidaceae bacterium]|nr:NUDIX domain-containing protein [Bacteroidaceae bacterium]